MCLLKWIVYHLGSNLQNYTKLNMSKDFIQGIVCKNMKSVKKIKSRRPGNAENHSWRKKFPFLWLQKQRRGSGFIHSGQLLLPTARSASSQRDCRRAEATELSWNTGPHSWCWDILGRKCHMRMLVCQGDAAWLVLGPCRGHQTSWQGPGNLLHAARLHLSTDSRVYRCLLLSAGKTPPAPENSTHLSFSLLTFQCPVIAPW